MWKTQKEYPFCGENNNFLFCIFVNYDLECFLKTSKQNCFDEEKENCFEPNQKIT